MAFGGFEREDYAAPMAEINTTPLVDVMLVLLVIFLVTAPMLTQGVKLELPKETAAEIPEKKVITLSINADGQYYIDDAALTAEALEARLSAAAKADPTQPIHLRADTNVAYGKVSHVLALAQRLGLSNVGFLTEPK